MRAGGRERGTRQYLDENNADLGRYIVIMIMIKNGMPSDEKVSRDNQGVISENVAKLVDCELINKIQNYDLKNDLDNGSVNIVQIAMRQFLAKTSRY
jgi:hypothetical protein